MTQRLARGPDAITFDFYNTLAFHRAGVGRGRALMSWLADRELESAAWEHRILYDVFERHGSEYRPDLKGEAKRRFMERFAMSVFRRLEVRATSEQVRRSATEIWQLLGPSCLGLFPEVESVLDRVKATGLKLAIVSNWQCGLAGFVSELGLARFFDHVLASAEVGHAKPDPAIFLEACRRLGVRPEHVLHVGDTMTDDVEGASAVGMHTALVRRAATRADDADASSTVVLSDLGGVLSLIPE